MPPSKESPVRGIRCRNGDAAAESLQAPTRLAKEISASGKEQRSGDAGCVPEVEQGRVEAELGARPRNEDSCEARGVGLAAQEMLVRASAAIANAEAVLLSYEAEQRLKNVDLDTALTFEEQVRRSDRIAEELLKEEQRKKEREEKKKEAAKERKVKKKQRDVCGDFLPALVFPRGKDGYVIKQGDKGWGY